MSETTQTTNETQGADKKKEIIKNFIWVMVGVIIGIVIGYACFADAIAGASKNITQTSKSEIQTEATSEVASLDEEVRDALGISTYLYEHEVLSGSQAEEAKDRIFKELNKIKNGSTYMQLQVASDTYESYMYNTNGECYAQVSDGSYQSVIRNDGKTIKYENESGAIAVGKDIEVLELAFNAVEAAVNGVEGAQLFYMTPAEETEENKNVFEYRVDLVGEKAVKACLSLDDEGFAQTTLDNLKAGLDEDWEPHLIMGYIVSTDNKDSKEDNILVFNYYVDDEEITNWVMQGYVNVDDWKLDETWYTTDFSTIEGDAYADMMLKLNTELDGILDKYFKDNNIELETDEIESTTEVETTETETEITTEVETEIKAEDETVENTTETE